MPRLQLHPQRYPRNRQSGQPCAGAVCRTLLQSAGSRAPHQAAPAQPAWRLAACCEAAGAALLGHTGCPLLGRAASHRTKSTCNAMVITSRLPPKTKIFCHEPCPPRLHLTRFSRLAEDAGGARSSGASAPHDNGSGKAGQDNESELAFINGCDKEQRACRQLESL